MTVDAPHAGGMESDLERVALAIWAANNDIEPSDDFTELWINRTDAYIKCKYLKMAKAALTARDNSGVGYEQIRKAIWDRIEKRIEQVPTDGIAADGGHSDIVQAQNRGERMGLRGARLSALTTLKKFSAQLTAQSSTNAELEARIMELEATVDRMCRTRESREENIRDLRTTNAALLEALVDLMRGYDEERQAIDVSADAGCLECTAGTTPNDLNTGPCAFHKARTAISNAKPGVAR